MSSCTSCSARSRPAAASSLSPRACALRPPRVKRSSGWVTTANTSRSVLATKSSAPGRQFSIVRSRVGSARRPAAFAAFSAPSACARAAAARGEWARARATASARVSVSPGAASDRAGADTWAGGGSAGAWARRRRSQMVMAHLGRDAGSTSQVGGPVENRRVQEGHGGSDGGLYASEGATIRSQGREEVRGPAGGIQRLGRRPAGLELARASRRGLTLDRRRQRSLGCPGRRPRGRELVRLLRRHPRARVAFTTAELRGKLAHDGRS